MIMRKIFFFVAAIVAAMTVNAATTVELADVANYIDFQALSVSDPAMVQATVTSTEPYELANGTILKGFMKADGTEAANTWIVRNSYNTTLPTPTWAEADSLNVGTMFRAAKGTTIELGAFDICADGKLVVYYQPNGDSERGVSISVYGEEQVGTNLTGDGNKIDGVRPAYAGEITLPAGSYDAGDVVIKLVNNTCNIFGVGVLQGNSCATIDGISYSLCETELTATVIRGSDYMGLIVIPSFITNDTKTYSVTSIGFSAFSGCSSLTSVTIGNSVTSIGNYAFSGCTSLTSVVWNATNCADFSYSSSAPFYNIRSQITSFVFGNEVEHIPAYLCYGMNSLTTIEIPNSVTSIGSSAFSSCSSLTSVAIGNSVTSIGNSAFSDCSSLTSVTIPNSVTSIGRSAFSGCSSLTSVTIPNSVTSIGVGAFMDCSSLTSITNYATTPQVIYYNSFYNVDISACTLYVPAESLEAYQGADVWKEFANIVAIQEDPHLEPELVEGDYAIQYLDDNDNELYNELVTLHVPVVPEIAGFTFIGWQASGMLEDGIIIQAIYQYNGISTAAPEVVTNPANPTQKLIRYGNIYILRDGKTYTIMGAVVK